MYYDVGTLSGPTAHNTELHLAPADKNRSLACLPIFLDSVFVCVC